MAELYVETNQGSGQVKLLSELPRYQGQFRFILTLLNAPPHPPIPLLFFLFIQS